jgi:hypothetical protein
MTLTRRSRALVVVALVLCVAAAAAVGLEMRGEDTQASSSGHGYAVTTLASDTADSSLADETLAADPARKQPTLDKFQSKNPFKPIYVQSTAGTSTDTTTDTSSATTPAQPTGAKVKVNGVAMTVKVGDGVPSNSPVFTIGAINSNDVVFKLMGDNEFEDGSTSVTVGVGESVEVTNKDSDKTYTLSVTEVLFADGTSTDASVSTSGHTFTALSISSAGGVATVTLKVDGKLFSDKKAGDVLSTSAGDVKIVAINEGAQSVTVLWGDANLVLHVGQSLVK